jgi:2-iminobutanoate/2-iminopropanoate deaminase
VRIDGDHVWVTAQIGRDPESGDFVAGGFEPEFHQAISNLAAILEEAGSSLADVVNTCVQFVDEDDLDAMNRVYAERFPTPYPSRTSFGVAFLWKGAKVQIDAVARRSGA